MYKKWKAKYEWRPNFAYFKKLYVWKMQISMFWDWKMHSIVIWKYSCWRRCENRITSKRKSEHLVKLKMEYSYRSPFLEQSIWSNNDLQIARLLRWRQMVQTWNWEHLNINYKSSYMQWRWIKLFRMYF